MSKLSNTSDNADIGRRLVAVRSATGLTQFEFADKLGLSPRAYANYERGEREMPTALFKALLDVFRIDPVWMLGGPEPEPLFIGSRRLDADLLQGIIELIEEWLAKHRRALKPAKKARVVRLAYEHCIERGNVDTGHVREMLSLAA